LLAELNPVNTILLISTVCCALTFALPQHSYFPIKTATVSEGLTQFESEGYGKSLERINEPPLPEAAENTTIEIYRLLILPTWGNSNAVRVQKRGEFFHLSARRLDGQAGDDPGNLVESKAFEVDAEDAKTLGALIQSMNFFQMATEDDVRGMDGDEWVMEGVTQGNYHVARRWCAPSYGPDKRGLKPFLALCKFLIDKSNLSERPKNKDHKLI
jgi:hypothetical protein